MKLNRNKSFGRIGGEFIPQGCDQPATYEQDGRFFDQFDEEITPPGSKKQVVPAVKSEADRSAPKAKAKGESDTDRHARNKAQAEKNMAEASAEPIMAPAELLDQCESMAWGKFHIEAKRTLGPSCPGGKDAILAELKRAASASTGRADRRSAQAGKKTNGSVPDTQQPPPPAAPGSVDLAQWGMGKKEYLWGQVRGAIRTQLSMVVEKRRDAVHALVDNKIIPAHLARTDFESSDK